MTYEAKKKSKRGRPPQAFKKEIDEQRESALVSAIDEFPDAHHNELKRIMLRKHVMVGRTSERKIQELLERGWIVTIRKGNKKFYRIVDSLHLRDSAKNLNVYISSMDKRIKTLKKVYHKLSLVEKILTANQLVKQLQSNLYGLELYFGFYPENRITHYQEITASMNKQRKKIIDIISSDSRRDNLNSALVSELINIRPEQNNQIDALLESKIRP